MRHLSIVLLAACLNLLGAVTATAHHNRESYFDMDATIELKDVTAVSFKVVNPHSQLVFLVTDEQGKQAEWKAGILSANHLRRAGVPFDLIHPGDKLTVTGSPSRGDENVMWLYTVVLPNGDVADLFNAIRSGANPVTSAAAD